MYPLSPPPTRVERFGAAARDAGGAVILLRSADVIGDVCRRDHVVELRRRKILIGPALAGVGGDVRAAVVAVGQALRIVRRDP
jgi:hypothetical protein